jgi:hypothetical protein
MNISLQPNETIALGVAFFTILTSLSAVFGYRLALKNFGINNQLDLSIAPLKKKFGENNVHLEENQDPINRLSVSLTFKIQNFSKTAMIIEGMYFPWRVSAIAALAKEEIGPGIQFESNGTYRASLENPNSEVINPNEIRFLKVYTSNNGKKFNPVSFQKLLNKSYVIARYSNDKISKRRKYRLTISPELSSQDEQSLIASGFYKLPRSIIFKRTIRKKLTKTHSGIRVSAGGLRNRAEN